jgi:hypothetical protein
VAELYAPLWQEVAALFAKWNAFVRLFATAESDLEVLNRAAGDFFALCQDVMLGDLILSVGRLTDEIGTGRKTTLGLATLIQAIDASRHGVLRSDAEAKLVLAREKSAFAREWRNRRVAHLDLGTALETRADPLPDYTRAEVQQAVDAIGAVLNAIAIYLGHGPTDFANVIHQRGDADSLIKRLRDGLELQDWRCTARMNGGTGILPPEV